MGAAGIVSGVLNQDNSIDIRRTKELIGLTSPLPFTFHRAFDWTPKPVKSMYKLIEIGADRILTSGQQSTAKKGLELLLKLKEKAEDKITILPGSGINPDNVNLFQKNGFKELHASATSNLKTTDSPKVSMNSISLLSDSSIYFSDLDKIKSILKHISNED